MGLAKLAGPTGGTVLGERTSVMGLRCHGRYLGALGECPPVLGPREVHRVRGKASRGKTERLRAPAIPGLFVWPAAVTPLGRGGRARG